MTLVTIDLGDVAGGHDPDDYVIIRAEAFRESHSGGVTSTAEVKVPLVDGVGQAEVEPGPVVVSFRCRAVADTREKRGVVPSSGTVGIERVLENAFEYLPPVVNHALETIKGAVAAEVDAIKWDRGHVPLDATSISDLVVGSWNVSNDTRAAIVDSPGLRLGNLSIGSIGTSKTATFISQGTASEPPMAWVQAERGGVWSGWDRLALADAVEAADTALGQRITDEKWLRPQLGSGSSIDTLHGQTAVGIHPVRGAVGGLPVSAPGWVTILYNDVSGSTTQIYTAASYSVSGEWQREYWLGEWRPWRDTSMGTAIQDKADTSYVDEADATLGQLIDGKADSSTMEAADTALGQRIDAEKWRKPGLISDSLDDYNSVAHEGLHSVRSSTPGKPWNLPGWVTVTRNPSDGRVKQIFRPSNAGQTWTAQRVFGGGAWTNWIRDSWDKGGLGSSDDLDAVHGQDSVGHYPLLSGVKNSPEGINGLMEVTYDRGTESTQQIVWSTVHTENGVAFRRVRRGGVWHDWTQVGWGSRQVSTAGDLDEQVRPGNYHISSSYTANAPVAEPGNMVVQIANNVIIQNFVTSGFHPRVFVRSRTEGMWSAWSEPGRRVSRPMSWDASTSEAKASHRIPAYMTHEGRYYWSVRAYRLFLSEDAGKTWDSDPIWRSEGEGSETLRELPNGELLLVADHVGGDRVRDVWVSSGMSTDPRTATWTKTLPGRAPHIKYADGWSISVHENMVLLAEYGPKSFGTWQGTYIEEGENARYVYLSEDYGMTWRTIFDLNDWLYAQGRTSMQHQHMHGVAYDPWWNRIWLTWGDNVAGQGSNGVLYSDDLGVTWETAMFVSDPGGTGIEGSPQVVGILPMEKCILFGGDQYPSGVMRIDRRGGKTRANWSWQVAYQHHTGRHLCGVITPVSLPNGDKAAYFLFVPEGVSTTSFVVATRDGWDWDVLWESEVDDRLSTIVGPTPDGEMIGGYRPAGTSDWVEVRGRADLYRTDAGSGAEILRIMENRLGDALEAHSNQ